MAKLTNLTVHYISLVDKPATGKALALKSSEGDVIESVPHKSAGSGFGQPQAACKGSHTDVAYQTFALTKADDERMVAYGVVYAPDQEDSHGDSADAETIRRAAYEFMRKARTPQVDVQHSFDSADAFIAESWIVRSGDAYFPNEADAWAVGIQVRDQSLWKQLKNGELTGISLAGMAQRISDEPQHTYTEKSLFNFFKSFLKQEQPTMKDDDIRQLVKDEMATALAPAIKQALADAGVISKTDEPATQGTDQAAGTDIAKAVSTAVTEGMQSLEKSLDEKLAKALAKGAAEGHHTTQEQESFA